MIDWLVIYKNIKGTASESEKKEFRKWLNKSDIRKRYVDELNKYFKLDGAFTPLTNDQLASKFQKATAEIKENEYNRKKTSNLGRVSLAAATVAAAVMTISFLLYFTDDSGGKKITAEVHKKIDGPVLILENGANIDLEKVNSIKEDYLVEKVENSKISYLQKNSYIKSSEKILYNTIVIPSCHNFTIILDDSTEVTLNANSQLRYPVSFNGDKREVFLKGEGYFNVKKGARPFIVTTDAISVKVYGTEFNINTGKEIIETVLISGSVSVTVKNNPGDEIPMIPNQRFSLNSRNNEVIVENVNPYNYIAWKEGLFVCDNENIDVILTQIAQWYGVKFNYTNTKLLNTKLSIKLKRTTPLNNILRALEDISGVKIVKVNLNTYVIE